MRRLQKIVRAGYVFVKAPNHPNRNARGEIREHRLVMERHLGRLLKRTEIVHHKNHRRDDNRLRNLQLVKNSSEHAKMHPHPKSNRQCRFCNSPHFGKGRCLSHYNRWRYKSGLAKSPCFKCGKPISASKSYLPKDGKKMCRSCRWPKGHCKVCNRFGPLVKGVCKRHYRGASLFTKCFDCGKQIRKSGRNRFPPRCWKCTYHL